MAKQGRVMRVGDKAEVSAKQFTKARVKSPWLSLYSTLVTWASVALISLLVMASGFADSVKPANPPPFFSTLHSSSHAQSKTSNPASTHAQGWEKDWRRYLKLADSQSQPYLSTQLGNLLYRSEIKLHEITHVDPFTGNVSLHLPLVAIPGGDGLPLQITGSYSLLDPFVMGSDVSDRQHGYNINRLGYRFNYFVGILEDKTPYTASFPAFQDPSGNIHVLYPQNGSRYYSKDHWQATLSKQAYPRFQGSFIYSGRVTSPNGTQYTVVSKGGFTSPVTQITSPNGQTIQYTYATGANGVLLKVRTSDGYQLGFSYSYVAGVAVLTHMASSDGRHWYFKYTTAHNSPVLYQILLPDGSQWQFNWKVLTDPDASDPQVYTVLADMTYPRGAKVAYTYGFLPMVESAEVNIKQPDRMIDPYVIRVQKSGPFLPSATWTYTYDHMPNNQSYLYGKHTMVTAPDRKTIYTFDTQRDLFTLAFYDPIQHAYATTTSPVPTPQTGLLLDKEITTLNGIPLENTQLTWGFKNISTAPVYVHPISQSAWSGPYDPNTGTFMAELTQKKITRYSQGVGTTYLTLYTNFNAQGLAQHVVETSDQGSFSKDLTYFINPSHWMVKLQDTTLYNAQKQPVKTLRSTFDSLGNLLTHTVDGVKTTYTYDAHGNVTSKTNALGQKTTFADYQAGLPQTVTDPLGAVKRFVVQNNGTVTSATDPLGNTTTYQYDPLYRLSLITPPLHAPTKLLWQDRPTGSTQTVIRGPSQQVTAFDGWGNPISVDTEDTTQKIHRRVIRRYDAEKRCVFKSYPNQTTGVVTRYDPLNRITRIEQAAPFTDRNTLTNPYVTQLTYLPKNRVQLTDPLGHVTTKQYRAFGNPNQKQLMGIEQPNGTITTITRNTLGQITQVQQGQWQRQYHYNQQGYLTQVINPETGITTYGRDLLGNKRSEQVGQSGVTQYQYDADQRLTTITYPGTSTSPITRTYDQKGELIQTTNQQATWQYAYDANGHLLSATLTALGHQLALQYTYDALDHLLSMTYPDHTVLHFAPNAFGEPTQLLPFVSSVTYFPNGQVQSWTDANGVKTTDTLTPRQFIASRVSQKAGAAALVNRQYRYDWVGNLSQLTDQLNSTNNQTLHYNAVNWLTDASGPWGSGQIAYDVTGNITQKTMGSHVITYTYDPTTNQLSAMGGSDPATLSYDGFGNLTSDGTQRFTYNAAQALTSITGHNRLGQPEVLTYRYDGNHHRLAVTEATAKGPTTVLELHQANQMPYTLQNVAGHLVATDFIALAGHPIAKVTHPAGQAGTVSDALYYLNDLLGSPIVATDSTGSVQWQQTYLPYGTEQAVAQQATRHVGYTGQLHNRQTGLSYFGARYYNPLIGRFIQPDPVGFKAKNPLSFNRYAYANDNPYRFKDPTGQFPEGFFGGVMGMLEALPAEQGAVEAIEVGGKALGEVADAVGEVGAKVAAEGESLMTEVGHEISEIATPYGTAKQEISERAINIKNSVQNGAPIYRVGRFGVQNTNDAQFWSPINPLEEANYASEFGLPSNSGMDWVMKGYVRGNFITRAAPGLGQNNGGAIEVVTSPGDVNTIWFSSL